MVKNGMQDLVDTDAGETLGRVAPLSQLADYEVADGYPEIRGWDVRDSAGRSIGYVYDLLADVATLRVRYLDVELDSALAGGAADTRVLIPLELVELNGGAEGVVLGGVDAAAVHTLVPYARRGVARDREVELARPGGPADVAPTTLETEAEIGRERHFDDERLFARGEGAGLFAPRDAQPSDVRTAMSVDTDRSQRRVPVAREDVEIERRPIRPGEEFRGADVQGDEIRIPIMAEEVVVEKRLVTREVLVIRKRVITEERTIEADVRTERVEIDDPHGRVRNVRAAEGPGAAT